MMCVVRIIVSHVALTWLFCFATEQRDMLHLSLTEEQDPGHRLGTVRDSLTLRSTYNDSILDMMTFRFDDNQSHSHLFHIDPISGTIRTRVKVDREALPHCVQAESCSVTLDVRTQPSLYFLIIKVKVDILDINDNAPRFAQAGITVIVPESSPPGTVLPIEAPYDPDSPRCGLASYSLVEPSALFDVLITEPIQSADEIYLVLKEKLDHEKSTYHFLEIRVFDGCDPVQYGSIAVNVAVSDVNDNAPVFSQHSYDVTIPEDTSIYSEIVHVVALDPDTSDGGTVVYSLQSGHPEFTIDGLSGWVTLIRTLDYEKETTYKLTVVATDQHPISPMSSVTVITVHVSDVNDNRPDMHLTILVDQISDQKLLVYENEPTGLRILYVMTSDSDKGIESNITCTVQNDHVILRNEGVGSYLETGVVLDRERLPSFEISITCSDNSIPALSVNKQFEILVGDENDNAPSFEQDVYFLAIEENQTIGSHVTDIRALDPDGGENNRVTYHLAVGSDSHFTIQRDTGSIVLKEEIAKSGGNTSPYLNITVVASDQGNPSLSSTADIIFAVLRLYEDPPEIENDFYSFELSENMPAYTTVGKILLKYPYKVPAEIIVFELDSLDMPFSVSNGDGIIKSTERLDREQQKIYTFGVTIRYARQVAFSYVATSVIIGDLNDNMPSILYPNSLNYSVRIANTAPIGSTVTQIIAVDPDSGNNSVLSYSLLGNPGIEISIARLTGVIYVAEDISHMDNTNVTLVVLIEDKGVPQLSKTASLEIIVQRTQSRAIISRLTVLNMDWIVGISTGAVLMLAIIIVIVFVVCRRQNITNRKYKDIERKLESLRNVNNDYADVQASHAGESSVTGSMNNNYFHDEMMAFGDMHNEWISKRRWLQNDVDIESVCSADVTASDSGRGSSMNAMTCEMTAGTGTVHHSPPHQNILPDHRKTDNRHTTNSFGIARSTSDNVHSANSRHCSDYDARMLRRYLSESNAPRHCIEKLMKEFECHPLQGLKTRSETHANVVDKDTPLPSCSLVDVGDTWVI